MKKYLYRLVIVLALAAGVAPAAWAATQAPQLDKIIDGIEKRYAGNGFAARFFQESMLKAMQISDTAEGSLTVKRPGKMRWEYTLPDPQIIMSDGANLWIYRPKDHQVMVGKAPDFFSAGKGAGFLADIRQIRSSFQVDLQPAQSPEYYRLQLLPKSPTPELARVLLSVSRATFQVDQVVTFNAYGDETRIVLSEYRFNLNPNDSLFTFEPPEGVDVVQIDQP